MSTLDTVFLIITACAISLFFLLGAALMVAALALVANVKQLIAKAENVVDSVETATETIKNIGQNAGGPLAALKIIRNIVKLVNRK